LFSVGVELFVERGSISDARLQLHCAVDGFYGLVAIDSYPKSDLAGVILGGYVFIASTALTALIHLMSPK